MTAGITVTIPREGKRSRVLRFEAGSFEDEAISRIVGVDKFKDRVALRASEARASDFPVADGYRPLGFTVRDVMDPYLVNFEVAETSDVGPLTSISAGRRLSESTFVDSVRVFIDHFLYYVRRDVIFTVSDVVHAIGRMRSRLLTSEMQVGFSPGSVACALSVLVREGRLGKKTVNGVAVRDQFKKL